MWCIPLANWLHRRCFAALPSAGLLDISITRGMSSSHLSLDYSSKMDPPNTSSRGHSVLKYQRDRTQLILVYAPFLSTFIQILSISLAETLSKYITIRKHITTKYSWLLHDNISNKAIKKNGRTTSVTFLCTSLIKIKKNVWMAK